MLIMNVILPAGFDAAVGAKGTSDLSTKKRQFRIRESD